MKILKFVGLFSLVLVVLFISSLFILHYSFPKIDTDVSILVLGKGGENHTGPDLTDTIMVAYLNSESNKQSLPLRGKTLILSLPRDIWVSEIRAKLNTAYHYGGFKMAGDSVMSITGLPISYTVVIDFSLFTDLIDSIGGINVNVENSFVDEKYPIMGKEEDLCGGDKLYACRYETLSIVKGVQDMNGELALKYVRSRNAEGDEGTDLAREKRQQKIIEAIKNKLLSKDVILNPTRIKNMYKVFTTHVETDMDRKIVLTIVRFIIESKFDINFLNIPEDFLVVSQNNKKYDKQYVFIPKSGSWKELQEWVQKAI